MLSKKCQYALHALIYLADLKDDSSVTIGEIAKAKAIPKKFLEAILLDLKNAGILGSKKGKSGGYYLIKHADQIPIIEVIRHIDGAVAMLPCVSLNFYDSCGMCADEHTCRINHLFGQVRDATLKILSHNTIADLANTNR
ncbi:MAG TPA: Rrf2 family transcriptional regulator [Chryseolinea sp.]|nr:Rrf2 family transcriptional regulator [Chryseolinea sp.]